jgi:hypothetical protein
LKQFNIILSFKIISTWRYSMSSYRNLLGLLIALFLAMILGCSDPGPAEKAGEEIDEIIEDMGEALEPKPED